MTHAARAVGKGHSVGIVHRDLKPDNIFICHNEDEEIAKVLDFGIAKALEGSLSMSSSPDTRTGALLGTPYYMSPEQAAGNRSVDYRSDLWSLGVIAFECLLGRRPFVSDGLGDLLMQICAHPLPVPSQLGPVPAGFDEWWARAAAREPNHRFASAKELADSLKQVLLGGRGSLVSMVGADTSGSYRAHAVTPGLAHTTGALAISEIAVVPEKKASRTPWILAAVAAVAVVGGGAAVLAFAGGSGAAATAPTPAQEQQAEVQTTSIEPAVDPQPTPPPEPAIAAEGEGEGEQREQPDASPPATGAAKQRVAAAPAPKPKSAPLPAPTPAPAPAAPAPAPTQKKRDLGF
jgi:serine/threonine-protein kinase